MSVNLLDEYLENYLTDLDHIFDLSIFYIEAKSYTKILKLKIFFLKFPSVYKKSTKSSYPTAN